MAVNKELVVYFCRRHGIRKLSLFGSVLREGFGSHSDVDMLVEFQEGRQVGATLLLRPWSGKCPACFGRKADLRTPAELSRYFRQEVLGSSEVQYAQK